MCFFLFVFQTQWSVVSYNGCNGLPVCLQDSPPRSVDMSCVPGWPKLSFWCHWRNMGRRDDPSNNSNVLMRLVNRHLIPNSNLKET